MFFWFKIFCLTLVLNIILMEPPEFEFRNITLGHSGFLITWKPKGIQNENHTETHFKFGHRIKDDQKDGNFSFSKLVNILYHQHKIHSLKEHTLYEVIIQQYSSNKEESLEKKDVFEMKTNYKTNMKPAKPDLRVDTSNMMQMVENVGEIIRITWLPCGGEGNCDGKEAGTHFATKIRILDRRGEYRVEQYVNGYEHMVCQPGIFYEVTIISINNHSETESDPREMYFEPKFGPVKAVKVVSFANASVLISWKPPDYSFDKLSEYKIIVTNDSSIIDNQLLIIRPWEIPLNRPIIFVNAALKEKLLDKHECQLDPGITYTFSITPYGTLGAGLETRVKYTMPVDKDD